MKHKFKLTLSFNLNLAKGEKLDRKTLTAFKNQVHNMAHDWDVNFKADFDGPNGAYHRDIVPSNVQCRIKEIKS